MGSSDERHSEHVEQYPGIPAPWPWWTTTFQGRIYRPVMRLMHRWGWCYAPPTLTGDPRTVWCHWCGMRGRVMAGNGRRPKDG